MEREVRDRESRERNIEKEGRDRESREKRKKEERRLKLLNKKWFDGHSSQFPLV